MSVQIPKPDADLSSTTSDENSQNPQPISPIRIPKSPKNNPSVTWNLDFNQEKNVSNSHDDCKDCIAIGYGTIMIVGAGITVLVAAILGLIGIINISNKTVKDMCPESSLWPFVLTWVILVFANLMSANVANKKKDSDPICNIICALCQLTALTIWGIIEIWFIASDCDRLQDKMIYLSAEIIVITYTVILGHVILGGIGVICYQSCKSKQIPQTTVKELESSIYGV